jgi:hypothetical protein
MFINSGFCQSFERIRAGIGVGREASFVYKAALGANLVVISGGGNGSGDAREKEI